MKEPVGCGGFISLSTLLLISHKKCVSLDPISPPASSLLLGLGMNIVALDRVMLDVECSVCRRVIDYHTRPIIRQSTGSWWPQRARFFSQVGWFSWPLSLVKTLSHTFQGWYIIAINRFLSVRVFVVLNSTLSLSHAFNRVSRLWGTLSPPQKHSRTSASLAVYRHWEEGNPPRKDIRSLTRLTPNHRTHLM